MDLIETKPALLVVAIKVVCKSIDPGKYVDNLVNNIIREFGGEVLYKYGGVVLEFPYQFVSVASKAYIMTTHFKNSGHDFDIPIILSIFDPMYPFGSSEEMFIENAINYFKNMLRQIGGNNKVDVKVIDTKFYVYPYPLISVFKTETLY